MLMFNLLMAHFLHQLNNHLLDEKNVLLTV